MDQRQNSRLGEGAERRGSWISISIRETLDVGSFATFVCVSVPPIQVVRIIVSVYALSSILRSRFPIIQFHET